MEANDGSDWVSWREREKATERETATRPSCWLTFELWPSNFQLVQQRTLPAENSELFQRRTQRLVELATTKNSLRELISRNINGNSNNGTNSGADKINKFKPVQWPGSGSVWCISADFIASHLSTTTTATWGPNDKSHCRLNNTGD